MESVGQLNQQWLVVHGQERLPQADFDGMMINTALGKISRDATASKLLCLPQSAKRANLYSFVVYKAEG